MFLNNPARREEKSASSSTGTRWWEQPLVPTSSKTISAKLQNEMNLRQLDHHVGVNDVDQHVAIHVVDASHHQSLVVLYGLSPTPTDRPPCLLVWWFLLFGGPWLVVFGALWCLVAGGLLGRVEVVLWVCRGM